MPKKRSNELKCMIQFLIKLSTYLIFTTTVQTIPYYYPILLKHNPATYFLLSHQTASSWHQISIYPYRHLNN